MTERPLSHDEFMGLIAPELERHVDEAILSTPPETRPALMLRREQILRELTHATEVANLRHRLAQAEARLRPRLMSEAAD
jgi:hypothetical protein